MISSNMFLNVPIRVFFSHWPRFQIEITVSKPAQQYWFDCLWCFFVELVSLSFLYPLSDCKLQVNECKNVRSFTFVTNNNYLFWRYIHVREIQTSDMLKIWYVTWMYYVLLPFYNFMHVVISVVNFVLFCGFWNVL